MAQENQNTYCPFLWTEVFIDPKGDVYCCCRKKPEAYGNIKGDTLKNICSQERVQKLRQKSLEGTLECYEGCTLVDKTQQGSVPKTAAFDYFSHLRKLKIEFGELCNINCIMCWQDHKSRVMLDHRILVKNIDLTPFDNVSVQGGEPLAIADAKGYFDHVASENKNPIIMTNGLLITEEWAEKIVKHSDYVYVSLNAATAKTHETVNKGSKWGVVMRNIRRLNEARERHKSKVIIMGHMTIVLENLKEIALFLKDFRSFGFDQIDFGYDQKVPVYLKYNPRLRILLKKEIMKVYEASKDHAHVDLKRLKSLSLIEVEEVHV